MSGGTGQEALAVEWTGAFSNAYGNAKNWLDRRLVDDPKTPWDERQHVPDSDDRVLIRGGTIDLGDNRYISKSMQIEGGTTFLGGGSKSGLWTSLTVAPGIQVTLNGNLDGGSRELLVKSGATLVVQGNLWADKATFEANSVVTVSGIVQTDVAPINSAANKFTAAAVKGQGLTTSRGEARVGNLAGQTVTIGSGSALYVSGTIAGVKQATFAGNTTVECRDLVLKGNQVLVSAAKKFKATTATVDAGTIQITGGETQIATLQVLNGGSLAVRAGILSTGIAYLGKSTTSTSTDGKAAVGGAGTQSPRWITDSLTLTNASLTVGVGGALHAKQALTLDVCWSGVENYLTGRGGFPSEGLIVSGGSVTVGTAGAEYADTLTIRPGGTLNTDLSAIRVARLAIRRADANQRGEMDARKSVIIGDVVNEGQLSLGTDVFWDHGNRIEGSFAQTDTGVLLIPSAGADEGGGLISHAPKESDDTPCMLQVRDTVNLNGTLRFTQPAVFDASINTLEPRRGPRALSYGPVLRFNSLVGRFKTFDSPVIRYRVQDAYGRAPRRFPRNDSSASTISRTT